VDLPPFFLRSLNSDNLNFPNGLPTNDPTSIALCATAYFNTGFGPMSGTNFTLFMPHAVAHCSIGF
jgi:hypothetical protein